MSSQSFSQLITVNLQYNGIKITKQCSDVNCVKSIRIRGWSVPFLSILSPDAGKVAPEKTPNTDTFHTVVKFCGS